MTEKAYQGPCPACGYDGLEPDGKGYLRCPDCGACWAETYEPAQPAATDKPTKGGKEK